jgi:SAM-dependent methyltransferase
MRRAVEACDDEQLTDLWADLCIELEAVRGKCGDRWPEAVQVVRAMAGFWVFQQDPFTNHAYLRPRGYPGDAGLLDYIYRPRTLEAVRPTPAARALFEAMSEGIAPQAVRNRQDIVARLVDSEALEAGRPIRVASLGCGHLAEAEKMASLETGGIERFFAMDQDSQSLEEVARRFPYEAVAGAQVSVKDFLRGRASCVRDLDVFFAAGLFDYLPERAARLLVRRMFDRLVPGGTLLVANFLTGIPDRGYMEAMMDWWLTYRTEAEVAALDADIDPAAIAHNCTFVEPAGNIAFLHLSRA